ncbi:Hypothetical predicted protein [Podarcis lilfordi]|uniref:Uncharacterized protein n=1 Tax=Podarcis lilfordi TaxID=74358 RepID=A0AA35JMV6_9SAUR|nr:Hypothetical predicted protein [Podarcis lilfordi]
MATLRVYSLLRYPIALKLKRSKQRAIGPFYNGVDAALIKPKMDSSVQTTCRDP